MNLNCSLFLISTLAMFIYQYSSFSYSSELLIGSTKNKLIFVALALFNTSIYAMSQYIHVDYYLIILLFMCLLIVEFKLISKTDFVQVFCGASIFILHISALIIPIIVIISNVVKIAPAKLIEGTVYDNIAVIIVCVVLTIAHHIIRRFIDNTSIQIVTVKSNYSIILLCSIILIVILQIDHSATMMSDVFYPEQIFHSIAVSLTSLFIFYLFFIYAMHLIDASRFKRYSDMAMYRQHTISKEKERLILKVERDELTNVYNRRYIMSELETMCNENTDPFYVLFIDINALKFTNDTYGHKDGDRLIIKITHAILTAIRENDIVARIGGDEFLVVMPNVQVDECKKVIERIKKSIDKQNETDKILISASIGSIYVNEEVKKLGVSHILSVADENMRENKAAFYKERKSGTV